VEILADDRNRIDIRVVWALGSLGEELVQLVRRDQSAAQPGHPCAGGESGASEQSRPPSATVVSSDRVEPAAGNSITNRWLMS
jgi:hypothetical protein